MSRELSVIIVSYNVSPFLKLCLYSVQEAIKTLDAEVFIVDNASDDNSVEMVTKAFPGFNVIDNKTNKGFSTANNQAIEKATGRIILLLNPDTIIPEDTFTKLISFYDNHPDAAGVGVKMIDGSGNYLPESKRSLPSARDFIFRFSGMIKIFPESKVISRYVMGHLSPDKTWEIPVLAGAFLAFPRKVLERTEPLDEAFFMYGEDIDFSYRLSQIGKNYYYPGIKIIHFKGESTVKDENYIERFYGAMLIFTKKHFFPKYNRFQKLLMTAFINSIKNILKKTVRNASNPGKLEEENVKPVSFYVGSERGVGELKKVVKADKIKTVRSFDDIKTDVDEPALKTNIFIEQGAVPVMETIDFMEKNSNRYRYSFLSPDGDFYLYSMDSKATGKVVHL